MFNDDIQGSSLSFGKEDASLGTASVVVAGLLACTRVTKKKMSQTKYVFLGAGGVSFPPFIAKEGVNNIERLPLLASC